MDFIRFLLDQYETLQRGNTTFLSSVCSHSDKVKPGALFIALKGQRTDGHKAIAKAIKNGASALLVENSSTIPLSFRGLVLKYHKQTKGLQLPQLLNCFYKNPSQKLFTIGVTGSNGKTTFCFMLEHIFKKCGWPTAVIGTVDRHFQNDKQPSDLTTPDPVELFKTVSHFVKQGAKALVMEVSSIGLDQGRVEGMEFNGLVFTNLSQDHLDYHKDMEDYFQAKKKLFSLSKKSESFQLINTDDMYGKKLAQSLSFKYTYGRDPRADFFYKIKNRSLWSSDFVLHSPSGAFEVSLPVPGDHNVSNAVAALAVAVLTGFSLQEVGLALKSFAGVPGRWQRVSPKNLPFDILIDYAHTPAALRSVLEGLRALYNKKLLLVFGCGGDRDKSKRPQMMTEALQVADKIFFTSDNPRFESPESIIQDSFKNISKKEKQSITVEWDRKKAIKKALQVAGPGDCVLIAGKGHETYQIQKDKKIAFSDREVVQQNLCEMGRM